MAEGLWLVTKKIHGGDTLVDGVYAMLINDDDGTSEANVLLNAIAQFNGETGASVLPAGYFDAAVLISDLTAGALKDDNDFYVFTTMPRPALLKGEG